MNRYHDTASKERYKGELDTLTNLIKSHRDECKVLLIGDFQSFPEKMYDTNARNNIKRNPLSKLLCSFLQTNGL